MSELLGNLIRTILILGPLLVGAYGIIALFIAIRATLKARREAYEEKHTDFLNLKKRVQDKLKEDSPNGK